MPQAAMPYTGHMPRNIPKPVSEAEAMRALANEVRLVGRRRPVTLEYTKRPLPDGTVEKSSSTGTVSFFSGNVGMDTHSVTIETADKGPRTINLHRIHKIR